jgi:hypothetical protein
MPSYSSATTLIPENISSVIKKISPSASVSGSKKELLERLENLRREKKIGNKELCNMLADAIYYPYIEIQKDKIPEHLFTYFKKISDIK